MSEFWPKERKDTEQKVWPHFGTASSVLLIRERVLDLVKLKYGKAGTKFPGVWEVLHLVFVS